MEEHLNEHLKDEDEEEYIEVCKELINKLRSAETIDDLPVKEEIDYRLDEFIDRIFSNNCNFTLKDGTKVCCEKYTCVCFDDDLHWSFYHILDNDFYICLDCGEKIKNFEDLYEEVNDSIVEDDFYLPDNIKAVPISWDEDKIKEFYLDDINSDIENQKRDKERRKFHWQERQAEIRQEYELVGCDACANFDYGNQICMYSHKYDNGHCEDFEIKHY